MMNSKHMEEMYVRSLDSLNGCYVMVVGTCSMFHAMHEEENLMEETKLVEVETIHESDKIGET
jgi:hypothetical protein